MKNIKFSFCIPLIILIFSVYLVLFDLDFYKQEIPNYENYSLETQNLIHYFQGQSLNKSFYSEREILHLQDVHNIIWFSLLLILLLTIPIILSLYKDKKIHLKKECIHGGLYSLIFIILFSLVLGNFSSSFIIFHKILFTNDYWILPNSSTLIQMFPEGFFIQSTIQIVLYSIILSLLIIILGLKIPPEKKT